MRRRLALAAALAAPLLVGTLGASAAPYAGHHYALHADVALRGVDGARWELHLYATRAGQAVMGTEQQLHVDLSRCDQGCTSVGQWVRPLRAGEITVDERLAKGVLTTTLLGQRLQVQLTGRSEMYDEVGFYAGAVGAEVFGPTLASAHPSVGRERPAAGRVSFGRLTCQAVGGALIEEATADSEGASVRDPRKAVPAKAPRGLLGPRTACAPSR